MAEIDQIAAAKASLEMMIQDNQQMMDYFKETLEKLDSIEKLPPGIKRVQFRQLEQSGALKFQGADIRIFTSKVGKRALTPPQFVQRTNRRLRNTNSLIEAFLKHESFDGGSELKKEIDQLTNEIFNEKDQKEVINFKNKVESLRDSDLFTKYIEIKDVFIKKDKDLKTEAEIIATKETLADGEMICQTREEDLQNIQGKMEKGEISAEEAQTQIDALDDEPGKNGVTPDGNGAG